MNNTPQQFDQHAISMAETAVIIHEYLLDTPDSNATISWKNYCSINGIADGRNKLVQFAIKIENVWNTSEELGIEQTQIIEQNFDTFDLDFCPCLINFCESLKLEDSFWWAVDSELIRLFAIDPFDK